MMRNLQATIAAALNNAFIEKSDHQPVFFRLRHPGDAAAFETLLSLHPYLHAYDEIYTQLAELIKSRRPSQQLTETAIREQIEALTGSGDLYSYGVWVYYPWLNKVVHLLDEAEFVELRTSRNKQKITDAERALLATRKIGIIGLSVGQSAAISIVMERLCGEIRIADFDSLDLSNMNRIRTGVYNIGIPKTVMVAREIAEIDPFMRVSCYEEGIHDHNILNFLTDGGQLDLLVEECDSMDIKVLCRHHARALHIPVIMDTSDRGMVDVERFDLHHDLPILHGRVPDNLSPDAVRAMQGAEKMALVDQIVDFNSLSAGMRASLREIGKTISTWPQLASSVILGGAVIAHVCREIGLGHPLSSGRYYVDLEQIFKPQTSNDTQD